MSQKQQRPTLSGQRIKTRKRDEKEKYDPGTFRDQIVAGLKEANGDLELASKYLIQAGGKLNFRLYSETLFDVLIAGGTLAPGGSIVEDGPHSKSEICIFEANDDLESIKSIIAQLFSRTIRQYKYLEKALDEEIRKILLFLKGFTEEQRSKLAMGLAVFITTNLVLPTVISRIFSEHLVKEGIAVEFITQFFKAWLKEKDINSLISALKKAEVDGKLLELFPVNKRSEEAFETYFNDVGLTEIVKFQHSQYTAAVKNDLKKALKELVEQEGTNKEMLALCTEYKEKHMLEEHEICILVWKTVMNSVEWNKKEDLVAEQALRHLKVYAPVLSDFTTADKSELLLLLNVQEYCYDNMNFMKVFQKIILLFYKVEVLSEDTIIKWYNGAHGPKGKSVFLQQMEKMVHWLQHAEEESTDEED